MKNKKHEIGVISIADFLRVVNQILKKCRLCFSAFFYNKDAASVEAQNFTPLRTGAIMSKRDYLNFMEKEYVSGIFT